jgi:hypothetical protein
MEIEYTRYSGLIGLLYYRGWPNKSKIYIFYTYILIYIIICEILKFLSFYHRIEKVSPRTFATVLKKYS